MMIRASLIAIACGLGVFAPTAGAKTQPKAAMPAASFDCTKAKTGAEKAICASPDLRLADAQMAASFNRAKALYARDADATAALTQLQRRFNTRREALVGETHPDSLSLDVSMGAQVTLLDSLVAPRAGFIGDWVTETGVVTIKQTRAGLTVDLSAGEPTRGAWVCEISGVGLLANGRLTLRANRDGPGAGGWTITLSRRGGTLVVDETAPRGQTNALRPYCGMNGGLAGAYLPAKPPES